MSAVPKAELLVRSLLGDAVEGGAQQRVLGAMDDRGAEIALSLKRAVPFLMRRSVEIGANPSRLATARVIQEELTGPIFSVPLATDPGGSRAMLIFDRGAVAFLLNGVLGGVADDDAGDDNPDEPPTTITGPQKAVLGRIADAMLKAISDALASLGVRLRRLPPSSVTPPEGQFASMELTLGEGDSRKVVLAIARDALQSAGLGLFSESKQKDSSALRIPAVLSEVEVELVVELGRVRRRLADVEALRVGDTIRLGVPVRGSLTVHIQGHPIFRGRPTTSGTQLAVAILERATSGSSAPDTAGENAESRIAILEVPSP